MKVNLFPNSNPATDAERTEKIAAGGFRPRPFVERRFAFLLPNEKKPMIVLFTFILIF